MKQKLKVMFVLLVLMVVGFASTSIFSYFTARDALYHQVSANALPLTSDNIYSEIQRDLLSPVLISSLMAQDTFVRDWVMNGEKNSAKIVHYLKQIQQRYHTVTSFFVSDETLRYYHSSGVLKTVSRDDPQDRWYFRDRTMQQEYEINIDRDTADLSSMTIFINHRVVDYKGNFIGIIGVGLGVETVTTMVEHYQQRFKRTVIFTDTQGRVTLAGKDYHGGDELHETASLSPYVQQILNSSGTSLTINDGADTVFCNSRFVPEFKWYLIVLQKNIPGESAIRTTLLGNLIITLGVMAAILWLASMTIGSYQKSIESMAITDKLTGVANRRGFDSVFPRMLRSAQRSSLPLSLLLCDIDHFKQVNDAHGHIAGDQVLQTMAQFLQGQIRRADMLARWGGEEFMLVLSNCSAVDAALMAERMRIAIESRDFDVTQERIELTVSFGVTQVLPQDEIADVISRADRALYLAKDNGRNRVETV